MTVHTRIRNLLLKVSCCRVLFVCYQRSGSVFLGKFVRIVVCLVMGVWDRCQLKRVLVLFQWFVALVSLARMAWVLVWVFG